MRVGIGSDELHEETVGESFSADGTFHLYTGPERIGSTHTSPTGTSLLLSLVKVLPGGDSCLRGLKFWVGWRYPDLKAKLG